MPRFSGWNLLYNIAGMQARIHLVKDFIKTKLTIFSGENQIQEMMFIYEMKLTLLQIPRKLVNVLGLHVHVVVQITVSIYNVYRFWLLTMQKPSHIKSSKQKN